jgi:hypothetical protein
VGFKYIILEVDRKEAGLQRLPIIYPDILVHAHVAEAIMRLPNFVQHKATVASAGEINLTADYCGGGSETLKIEESDPDDRFLVNSFPYLHGIIL